MASTVDQQSPRRWQPYAWGVIVMLIAGVVFFVGLGECQLWDRDEPRNAGCAVEMMNRGDWVVPIFNSELRYQKPVMLYWLMMSAYQVFGVNEWSARFWSAIMGIGTVGLTYGIANRLFNLKTAIISAVALGSSPMFIVASRAATPDSALIFFSTATLFAFVMGAFEPNSAPHHKTAFKRGVRCNFHEIHWSWLMVMGVCMGAAMLTKGPIGFLMPVAIIGMYLLLIRQNAFYNAPLQPQISTSETSLNRSQRIIDRFSNVALACVKPWHPTHFLDTVLGMRPMTLLIVALLVAAPWYVWVGMRTDGDFIRIFFLKENLGRSTEVFESHSGGIGFYPVAVLVGFFPWSLFWLPVLLIVVRDLRKQKNEEGSCIQSRPEIVFLMCWIGVQISLFTIAATKLPSYVTPCYPALAILTSAALVKWQRQQTTLGSKWMPAVALITIAVGAVLAIGLSIISWQYFGDAWLGAVGVPVICAGILGLIYLTKKQDSRMITAFAIGAVGFSLVLFGYGTGKIASLQNNRNLLQHVKRLPSHVKVASFDCLESSWVFYSQRPVYELDKSARPNSSPGVQANAHAGVQKGAVPKDRKFWQPKVRLTPEQFANENPDSPVITTDDNLRTLQQQLPGDYEVVAEADYFLKNKRLVLLQPMRR